MYHHKNTLRHLRGALTLAILIAPVAQASTVTYLLDQSNRLPDGTDYLSVTLSDNGHDGVDFAVKTLDPLNNLAGSRFGIEKFAFNYIGDDNSGASVGALPSGWRTREDKRVGPFGRFEVDLSGRGNAYTDPLNFTVAGVDVAGIDDFFTAYVVGIKGEGGNSADDDSSSWCRDVNRGAYFAGGKAGAPDPVPVPASGWLFGSGLLAFAPAGWGRRKARAGGKADSCGHRC